MKIKKINIDFNKIRQDKKKMYGLIAICAVILLFIIFLLTIFFTHTSNKEEVEFFIRPKDNYSIVKSNLIKEKVIKSHSFTFNVVSKILSYKSCVKEGRYVIKPHTSILRMIYRLRNGNQTPVKIVITNARSVDDLAKEVTKNLMMSKEDFINEVNKQGYTYPTELFFSIVPDTYQAYWTITPKKLLNKLKEASDKFWQDKQETLQKSGYTKKEIIVLASIVNEETNKNDEKSRIAGVYVNRLKRGMPLQADPTIKFAVGDFSIKRILHEHLTIVSPFNTYLNTGLPPAPICLPSVQSLKKTLNYERHNYIYFCAKEDFSGYHNFASNDRDHVNNANRYRRALNQRGIL